jgi:hypothetical protein
MKCLMVTMRVFNVINGLLLGASCVCAFQLISTSITEFFLALYIGCVSREGSDTPHVVPH